MGEVYEVSDGDAEIERFEVRDLRVRTRFCIDNRFYDEYASILGCTISMVYIALVRHANKDQKTWPSQNRISQQLGITRQWVGAYLKILQHFNIIKSVRLGKMCNNRYYLIDERHWRYDYDVMFKEVSQALKLAEKAKVEGKKVADGVMSPKVTSLTGDIRCLQRLHHLLEKVTSNRKGKAVTGTQKGEKNISIKKVSPSTSKKERSEPEEITIGKGKHSREYYDVKNNQLVTEYYD